MYGLASCSHPFSTLATHSLCPLPRIVKVSGDFLYLGTEVSHLQLAGAGGSPCPIRPSHWPITSHHA